jgi:hypothetical protein
MKCHQCHTDLPAQARFCFNCGAKQIVADRQQKQATVEPMLIDLAEDIPQQLGTLFVKALQQRVEEEHQPGQVLDYSERLYASGFRDVVYRRAGILAGQFAEKPQSDWKPQLVNEKIVDFLESLLELFIIRYCKDINKTTLSEKVLQYQNSKPEDINYFQMAMDYLAFDEEPLETVYTDFLNMPVDGLKNASKFFLFPSQGERIWFICDQSLIGVCKEGFAMTEYGLYWKAQLQTARAVQYTGLDSIKKEKDWLLINGHFFNASPAINYKMMRLLKQLKRLAQKRSQG